MNRNLRRWKTLATLLLVAAVALASAVQADMIFMGNGNGEVIGRDEFNLGTEQVLSYLNFGGSMWPISKLVAANGDLVIGIGAGGTENVQMRHANDLTTWVTDIGTGYPISALG